MYGPGVGDRVQVRTATGQDRLLRVAEIGEGVVYVTTEEEYQRATTSHEKPTAFLGFPPEDVRKA